MGNLGFFCTNSYDFGMMEVSDTGNADKDLRG